MLKPHPFAMCGGGALSLGLSVSWPHHRSAARLPLLWRGPWALRPRLAAGLPLSRRRSARAHVNEHTNSEAGDTYARWLFIWSQAGQLYARWLFLAGRTSENSVITKFSLPYQPAPERYLMYAEL